MMSEEFSVNSRGNILGIKKYLHKGVLRGLPSLQIGGTTSIDLLLKDLGL